MSKKVIIAVLCVLLIAGGAFYRGYLKAVETEKQEYDAAADRAVEVMEEFLSDVEKLQKGKSVAFEALYGGSTDMMDALNDWAKRGHELERDPRERDALYEISGLAMSVFYDAAEIYFFAEKPDDTAAKKQEIKKNIEEIRASMGELDERYNLKKAE